jgi:hypothetical protein
VIVDVVREKTCSWSWFVIVGILVSRRIKDVIVVGVKT